MSGNYLRTAWRNLRAHKVYAAINIFGLAVGIATTLIIFFVIHYEVCYDNFQSRKDRICCMVNGYINPGNGEVAGQFSNEFTPLIFVIIVWLTVGYKAAKAAIANPVKSLRTE